MKLYHAELDEAQADPAIAALFAAQPGVTPFDRLDWLRLLADECLNDRHNFIALASDGAGTAALPLCTSANGLGALANWYSFIARPRASDSAAAARLLPAILRQLASHGRLTFAPLPAAEAVLMLRAARAAGWVAWAGDAGCNHVLHTGGRDFAAYWAARPGSLRETVRRKGRKGAVAIRIAHSFDPADWDAYTAIYAQSWKPAEASPQFLRRFALAECAAGRLRLGLATIDAVPVAAQLWTVENGTAYIHKLAQVPAADAHSPGTLLTHALFAAAIDQDQVAMIDFGTGDDAYKRDWMETVRPRFRVDAVHPGAVRHWPALGKLVARRVLRPGQYVNPALVDTESDG